MKGSQSKLTIYRKCQVWDWELAICGLTFFISFPYEIESLDF